MNPAARGLRGSTLEELLNFTNDRYRKQNLAIVQKIPTPITPVEINKENRTITLAYFEKKSTVDYIGVVQGIPICFDAKETKQKSLPIANIHAHQIEFMEDFTNQGGIAFVLVYFSTYNEYYFLPFKSLKIFWNNAKAGGRKSISYDDFDKKYLVYNRSGAYIHYLEAINVFLKEDENKEGGE
ncbi:MAG: Holliday junction resolvase RecU [Defluviitaleaceae bacterium]|nr:Holliday junction resolvase RecU [Defluviitaleaceae bacterium]